MANTKVTSRVLADDAVGLAQINIINDPSDGQVLTASNDGTNNYNLTWTTVSAGPTHKEGGTDFTSSILIGDSGTGTLSSASFNKV